MQCVWKKEGEPKIVAKSTIANKIYCWQNTNQNDDDDNHLEQQKCWSFVESCSIHGKCDLNVYDLLINL